MILIMKNYSSIWVAQWDILSDSLSCLAIRISPIFTKKNTKILIRATAFLKTAAKPMMNVACLKGRAQLSNPTLCLLD